MTPSHKAGVLLGCLLLAASGSAAALEPAYLDEMPSPERVLRDFKGEDRLDTLALQLGAMARLNRIVVEMAGARYHTPGQYPTPDEARILASIRAASEPLAAEAEATFDPALTGADTPRAEWRRSVARYRNSGDVYDRLMELYFSPQFRDAHGASLAERGATIDAARDAEERGRRALAGEPEPVAPKDRTWALVFGGAMLLWLVLGNLHLLLPIRVDASDPHVLRIGLKRHRLGSATGVLTDYAKKDEVKEVVYTRRNARGDEEHHSTYSTTHHESFVLAGPSPAEIHVASVAAVQRLYDRFDGRAGNRVTAVWASLKDADRYLRFYDWTRNAVVEHQATWGALEEMTPLRYWTVVPAAVLGAVIGATTGTFGSRDAPEFSAVATAAVAALAWYIGCRLLAWRRRATFARELTPLIQRLGNA
jgi:hypothetical protein